MTIPGLHKGLVGLGAVQALPSDVTLPTEEPRGAGTGSDPRKTGWFLLGRQHFRVHSWTWASGRAGTWAWPVRGGVALGRWLPLRPCLSQGGREDYLKYHGELGVLATAVCHQHPARVTFLTQGGTWGCPGGPRPVASHTTQVNLRLSGGQWLEPQGSSSLHLDLLPRERAVVGANTPVTLKPDLNGYQALSCQGLTGPITLGANRG